MQISLFLFPETPIRLNFSYYPKLASALYQAISYTDPDFANNLHDGVLYRNRIKLFGFSPLYSRHTEVWPEDRKKNISGGLVFKGICSFTICSPWPELMDRLCKGLSKISQLRIGSQLIRIQKAIPLDPPDWKKKMNWQFLQPASCVTSWSSKTKGKKLYILPGTTVEGHTCEELLQQNLIHKWRRLKETRQDIAKAWLQNEGDATELADITEKDVNVRLLPLSRSKKAHTKRHQIKNVPVFSWIAPVEITAPKAIQRIAWSCGLGEMNSMGFGVVEEAI